MPKQPNVIVFCTDHQRADLLGCMGHPRIKTPNLDKLAKRGVLIRNLYVQGTVCMPSRASIMTGKYPSSHGLTDNGYDLSKDERTIADLLKDAGYHTMLVGRSHIVCTQPRPHYPESGFYGYEQCAHAQVYCVGTDPGNAYLNWIKEEHPGQFEEIGYANSHLRDDMFGSFTSAPEELSMNSWVVGQSLDFIKEQREKNPEQPFYLWAGTWDPHSPYRVPAPWDAMYSPEDVPLPTSLEAELESFPPLLKRLAIKEWKKNPDVPLETVWRNSIAMFWGMISHIDDQIGRMVKGLEEMGILDDTVILFTSDHGDMLGEHHFIGKGLYFYDGALKVPGIMAGPGVPEGMELDCLAESVDLLPTILDLCSVDVPLEIQGKSLKPVMDNPGLEHKPDVYVEHDYHRYPPGDDISHEEDERVFSLYDGEYRIVWFKDRDYGQLFDFKKDPENFHNLWDDPEYAEIKQKMTAKLLNRLINIVTPPDTRKSAW